MVSGVNVIFGPVDVFFGVAVRTPYPDDDALARFFIVFSVIFASGAKAGAFAATTFFFGTSLPYLSKEERREGGREKEKRERK